LKTNVTLNDFKGNSSQVKGVLNVELTAGHKMLNTSFFVVNDHGPYSALLGRDWIHANCCVPSSMHQCLIQWDGDNIEVVPADDSRSVAQSSTSNEAECLSGRQELDWSFVDEAKNGIAPVLAIGIRF